MWSNPADPLAKLLFDKYGAHVLARPRASLPVLTVFGVRNGKVYVSGSLANLLRVPFEEPAITRDEPVLDISGTTSKATSGSIAVNFLQGFMALVGLGVGARVGTALERTGAAGYTFRFDECTMDSVADVFDLENRLSDTTFSRDKSAMRDDATYFIARGVHHCKALTFEALDKAGGKVDLGVDVAALADAKASLSIDKNRAITAKANAPLAYGVVLNELSYDKKRSRLRLSEVQNYVHVMGGADDVRVPAAVVQDPKSRVLVLEEGELT